MTSEAARPIRSEPVRVLLVEPNQAFAAAIAAYLHELADVQLAATARSVDEGLEKVETTAPDLVLVALQLGAASGLALVRTLRARGDTVPIVVVGLHAGSAYCRWIGGAGADGFIPKAEIERHLRAAIAALAGARSAQARYYCGAGCAERAAASECL